LGWTGSGGATDLWRYDTTTNAWTAMATFPGAGRYDAMCFVIGHKAYVVGGSTGGPPYKNDVWMYDAHQNTWTQMNNSPVGHVDACAAFAIGNHGYIGGGDDGSSSYNAFYKYDTTTDTWASIASYPIALAPTGNSRAFVVGSTGYVCTGTINYSHTLPSGYAYDTTTGAWTEFTNMGANGIERGYAAAFTIGNCGYIGTGKDSLGGMLQDLWGYCPCQNVTATYTIDNSSIQMNIYPNPSSGLLHIKYNVLSGQDLDFRVTDMFGRIVSTYKINSQEQEATINETSLSNGMYFYQVMDSGKLVSSGKFIIAK
ncbi:MAG TPA: kelch repeat-containing protein, partial [Bacteroidia bacterium]|nr:kelch repeat-containing protein [Bacteroidia bacterium]